MDVTIFGAGGIGGTLGAHMARAGHAVTFVEANAQHVAAIRERGLRVSGAADLVVHPQVVLPEEVGGLEVVLLAVKAPDTERALACIEPHLGELGYVVSLQNGFEVYRVAKAVSDTRTVAGELTVSALYRGPGEVVYNGPGSFRIGELDGSQTARLQELSSALSALVPVEVTANILGYLWGKAALAAVWFATALVDEDVPVVLEDARYLPTLGGLAAEVVNVADAVGVACEPIDGFDSRSFARATRDEAQVAASWEAQRRSWARYREKRTGVWRDLAVRHRRTEVDYLLEPILLWAAEHGVLVPRLCALVEMVKAAEQGTRRLGWANLDQLALVR